MVPVPLCREADHCDNQRDRARAGRQHRCHRGVGHGLRRVDTDFAGQQLRLGATARATGREDPSAGWHGGEFMFVIIKLTT